MKNRVFEIILGAIILISATIFVLYTVYISFSSGVRTYKLNAKFYNVGSLTEGSKVTINGYEIGKVTSVNLSYPDYAINVTMEVYSNIKIPIDSTLNIKAAGFFDPPVVSISPGKDKHMLKRGALITKTEDWVSLEEKIGSVFFSLGGTE